MLYRVALLSTFLHYLHLMTDTGGKTVQLFALRERFQATTRSLQEIFSAAISSRNIFSRDLFKKYFQSPSLQEIFSVANLFEETRSASRKGTLTFGTTFASTTEKDSLIFDFSSITRARIRQGSGNGPNIVC